MDLLENMGAFVRVVERGSFSAAARELGMGQPAVSKQVRALEQYLGGPLFARSTRQLSLTDQGRRFYDQCREILAHIEAAALSFSSGHERIAGPIRLAAPVSYGRLCAVPLIGEFMKRHPDVAIDLRLSDHNEDLLKENIDLAIRIGAVRSEGLVAVPLGASTRYVYAAPAYLHRRGTPRAPDGLADHNCIGFTLLEHYDRWRFKRASEEIDVSIKGNLTSNSSEAIREMVLAGLGISLSPKWLFATDVEQGKVLTVLDDYQTTALPVSAVLSPERRHSARVMAFVDFLREHART